MITVKALADRAGVIPDAVRHYVKIGLIRPRRNSANHYRLFSDSDVERVVFIGRAKSLGHTLEEMGWIFHGSERGYAPCPKVRDIMANRIAENRQRLEELFLLQRRMEAALEQWQKMPDGVPDGKSICHLNRGGCRTTRRLKRLTFV